MVSFSAPYDVPGALKIYYVDLVCSKHRKGRVSGAPRKCMRGSWDVGFVPEGSYEDLIPYYKKWILPLLRRLQ